MCNYKDVTWGKLAYLYHQVMINRDTGDEWIHKWANNTKVYLQGGSSSLNKEWKAWRLNYQNPIRKLSLKNGNLLIPKRKSSSFNANYIPKAITKLGDIIIQEITKGGIPKIEYNMSTDIWLPWNRTTTRTGKKCLKAWNIQDRYEYWKDVLQL